MIDPETLEWNKADGLVPAVVQDAATGEVRMLGYMDRAALDATLRDGFVTFHSRSRGRLWRKGESSGNVLEVVDVRSDCDRDALLILARPHGPTCHTGAVSCFGGDGAPGTGFLGELGRLIEERARADSAESYTARLLAGGVKRVAQKVGEEGVEVALAAVAGDAEEVTAEAADLVYHLSVLLQAAGSSWEEVTVELNRRHASSASASS
ncbi:bifunctional phosphoribosyl-AMP cyclohydrolase/phosphoribosyl-ATP diphosphatase HisIE [uncultured Sphingomonas sp.]|uniref:bifunctional phosphoribosyl-AMP cyclohydrolase/phosphoribosyl-ATP diphosphatase HisIE n=1 Tax=uncultured Sphingomonas sp. TaxID=158754 RepID=UPI0025FD84F9|nr:bifunctional phosphoribosyl-AMP cyclohydrolase/phosphoribosyl-ATP diphosphatase HisIE [uncultured Sphingomonas sp.]